jgi:hypothetical protein
VVVAASAACAAPKPHTFGAYNDLAPRVSAESGQKTPRQVTVALNRPANVAVFLVVPGRGSQLLYPADSTQSPHMESGTHTVTTSLARANADTTRNQQRRPNQEPNAAGRQGRGANGRGGFDPNGGASMTRGYLLVFATQDSLPYSTLSTKVSGISIPIDDDDALNTVTKLIRETTKATGQWAAYATEFTP